MKKLPVLPVFILCLIAAGCGTQKDDAVAIVNDTIITLSDFKEKIARLPENYREVVEGQERKFLDDIVMEQALYDRALDEGLHKDSETEALVEQAARKIIISRLVKTRVDDRVSVSEDQLRRYYDEHSEEFLLPARWRCAHILVSTQEQAEKLARDIAQGASFTELAKTYSQDGTASEGGDIGYFSEGQLIPEFEEACKKLDIGEISDVVHTKYGYHIIKLTDRKPPEVQVFSSVKNLIRKDLERKEKNALLEELMQEVKEAAHVVINEEILAGIETTETDDFAGDVHEHNEAPDAE